MHQDLLSSALFDIFSVIFVTRTDHEFTICRRRNNRCDYIIDKYPARINTPLIVDGLS